MLKQKSFNPFYKYLRPHAIKLSFSLVASMIVGCLTTAYPLILQRLLDSWNQLTPEYLLTLVALFLFVITTQSLLSYIGNIVFVSATQSALVAIRYDIYLRLSNKPLSFFHEEKEGYIVSVFTNDVNAVNSLITSGTISLITNIFRLAATLALLFLLEWRMTLILFALMSLYVVIYCTFGKRLKAKSQNYFRNLGIITNIIHEACTGMRTIKSFCYESQYGSYFSSSLKSTKIAYEQLNSSGVALSELCGYIGSFSLVCSIFFIGAILTPDSFSLGSAVAYFSLLSSAFNPLRSIMSIGIQYYSKQTR